MPFEKDKKGIDVSFKVKAGAAGRAPAFIPLLHDAFGAIQDKASK